MTSIVFLLDNWTSLVAQLVKNPPCNVGDPGSIPGVGSTPGERIGIPLQYSWASLMAQMVKDLPAVREWGSIPGLGKHPGGGHGNTL